jgi:hypothetical protein
MLAAGRARRPRASIASKNAGAIAARPAASRWPTRPPDYLRSIRGMDQDNQMVRSGDGRVPRCVLPTPDDHIRVGDAFNHRLPIFGCLPTPSIRTSWGAIEQDHR